MGPLLRMLVRKIHGLSRAVRPKGIRGQLESYRLFLYWLLRGSGESDMESILELSELNDGDSEARPSAEVFCIANGLYPRSTGEGSYLPRGPMRYELFEAIFQAQGGIRERMNLLEAGNRKELRVESSVLQTRLIILSFVLFIVPFATLLSASYILVESSPFFALFFAVHPITSYFVANWATMRDDILAS